MSHIHLTQWSVTFLESNEEVVMAIPPCLGVTQHAASASGAASPAHWHAAPSLASAAASGIQQDSAKLVPLVCAAPPVAPETPRAARGRSAGTPASAASDGSDADGSGDGSGADDAAADGENTARSTACKRPARRQRRSSFVPKAHNLRPGTPLGDVLATMGFDVDRALSTVQRSGIVVIPAVPQALLCQLERGPAGVSYNCVLCTYSSRTRSNTNTHTKVRLACAR